MANTFREELYTQIHMEKHMGKNMKRYMLKNFKIAIIFNEKQHMKAMLNFPLEN